MKCKGGGAHRVQDFQSHLCRGLLQVPKSCPLPSLNYESDTWLLKYRVYSKVLSLAKHIYSLDENTLSKQIMSKQISKDWPGLVKQAKFCSDKLGLTGVFDQSITKKQLKSKIKEPCQNHNDAKLKQQIQTYKKMAALRDELKKDNTYFYRDHITNVRTLFRFRVDLFEAKANFKNKYRNDTLLCDSCESKIDENTHVLHCPSYSKLRENKCLNNDSHLAEYLQKVIQIRMKLNLNR